MRKNEGLRPAALLLAAVLLFGLLPLRALAEEAAPEEEECAEEVTFSPAEPAEISAEEFAEEAEPAEESFPAGESTAPEQPASEEESGKATLVPVTLQTGTPGGFSLRIALSSSYSDGSVLLCPPGDGYAGAACFDDAQQSYQLPDIYDSFKSLVFEPSLGTDETAELRYTLNGTAKIRSLPAGKTTVPLLSVGMNTFSVVLTGSAQSTEYSFSVRVLPTIAALSVSAGGDALTPEPVFSPRVSDYSLSVPAGAERLTVSAVPKGADYTLLYEGGENPQVDIRDRESISVTVSAGGLSHAYCFALNRVTMGNLRVTVTPAEAVVKLYDKNGAELTENDDGSYSGDFSEGLHTYTACCYGYITQSGTVPPAGGELILTLKKAAAREGDEVSADWGSFRNSENNMGITDRALPTEEDAESVGLLWNRQLGVGWENAPSVQIIVDNVLVVLCGTSIYKLDLKTGETLQQGTMVAAPNWGYTPPGYAEGLIFAPLSGGVIQAFDARTLESVWIYRDPLGGQSLSPISYAGGYLYTGFWTGETTPGNYVCLSVTDEDPSSGTESKSALWRYAVPGGYYWAGSVIVGNAVIMGTGDGQAVRGSSRLLSLNRFTGRLISSLTLTDMGDQRASVAYEAASGQVYFTTQAGYICSAAVDTATGRLSDLRSQASSGRQATSTPVVYGGRAYYGVGSGISSSGSTGEFVVARADTLETLYTVPLRGYPQCSQLLSTAHLAEGYLYFYTTYNSKPGGVTLIRVDPTADTAAGAQTWELYNAEGFEEYCITSLICGTDGTIYYKNDSGNVLAVGIPTDASVERLIAAITEPVTIEQESTVLAARSAYDKLTAAARSRVSGYAKLVSAENVLRGIREKIKAAEEKIGAIGIVAATAECRALITAARAAYDALTPGERARVENYPTLTAAERKYDSLSGTGTTRAISATDPNAVTVTIGGVKYTVHRTAGELMQRIEKLNTHSDEQEIIAARSAYEVMTDELKAQVFNFAELKALCDGLSVKYHRDDYTGIYAEGLRWDQRLIIQPLGGGESYDRLRESASTLRGESVSGVWSVEITSLAEPNGAGESAEYTLCLPLGNAGETDRLFVHWLSADGVMRTLKCRREAGCAVTEVSGSGTAALVIEHTEALPTLDEAAADAAERDETASPAPERGRVSVWQLATLMLGGAVLAEALLLRRKKDSETK